MRFPIAIHKDHDSVYGVTVPDVPGCFSCGDTLDEAITNAEQAIAGHIETLLSLGEKVSFTAKSIEEHQANPDFTGATWALANVDMSRLDSKPERINISIPRFVLTRIDQHVASRHETRSGFLARAALELLSHEPDAMAG